MSYPTLGQWTENPIKRMRKLLYEPIALPPEPVNGTPTMQIQPEREPPSRVEPPPNGRDVTADAEYTVLPVEPPLPPRRIEEGAATEDVVIAGVSVPRVAVLGLGILVGAMVLRNL